MEKVGQIIKAQQSGGSKELARPGNKRLTRDSIVQLGTMLRQMSAAFPHQEYDPETTKVFLLTFEDLAMEFGVKNLEVALRWFLSRQKFFPHPAEVREELEEMAKKTKAEQAKSLPKIGCPKCHDGGWADGWILAEVNGIRVVKKCDCMIAREIAKKASAA